MAGKEKFFNYYYRVRESDKADVIVIVGSRPEAIKIYPIVSELIKRNISFSLISTGQQRNLLEQTLVDLELVPDINLDLMKTNQSPESFASRATEAISLKIKELKSKLILVQGDTASAFAGAMAGFFNQIPVGHVEAGLRSGDLKSPWPEEGFRRVIDSISKYLWLPTENTRQEFEIDQISRVTGNTVVDSLLKIIERESPPAAAKKSGIVATLHRRESFGEALTAAIGQIISLSKVVEEEVIFIKHPNPNVEQALKQHGEDLGKLKIIEPLPYSEFVKTLSKCRLLITDSGGLQEEATVLGVSTLIVRENTERPEAIDAGNAFLIGNRAERLVETATEILSNSREGSFNLVSFGDGMASKRIVDDIERELAK